MGEQGKRRAVLIGAAPHEDLHYLARVLRDDDFVICADGGRVKAETISVHPDWYVGDNDSGGTPDGLPSTLLPSEKDVSDMEMAVDQALALGYKELVLTGCTGGREDHHLANIGLLEQIHNRGGRGVLIDKNNEIRFLSPGVYRIPDQPHYKYFGLIPLDKVITGVTLQGVKYPLEKAALYRGSTRAVSNEILPGHEAVIEIGTGCALLVRALTTES